MGQTEKGVFGFGGDNSADIFGHISFPFALAAVPTVQIILSGNATPSGCTGDVSNPGALSGNLCIFEGYTEGGVSLTNIWEPGGAHEGSKLGVTLWASGGGSGNNDESGTWAATG